METAEDYWTNEFWQYAQQVKQELIKQELAEREQVNQQTDDPENNTTRSK